ncbi:hypothetical protein RIF29_30718 [Crotalaria pallida]|uniref:Bulb-type lectin domain-containing protein n=1 Tax=Crotalaria pallida TaxID=3830 RepID=A0AAN9EGQ4_CROPI
MSNKTRQLCSANNKYCIFFFRYSQERDLIYLGISSERNDIVWIANRNQPYVNISSLDLSLEHSGVLKIESQVEKPIILYSPPPHSTTTNMLATLLDTGNFVLQQLNPNGSTKSVLWQSFDYPTDALFPGMKLGANRKTGHSWSLVSYVSLKYPHPSPFSLEWEPKEGELNIKRRGRVIWKSGKLRNNNKFFENIPEESQLIYNCVGFISDEPNGCAFFSGKSLEGVPSVIGGTKFYMLVKKPQRRGNGYMFPEYVMEGVFSTKSDIYSFGVLLLEIVSGRRNNSFYDAEHPLNLVGHLMDPSLNGMFDPNEAERCIYVGLLCAEHYAKDRPNMSDIISMLTNKSVADTLPRRPAFYFGKQIFEVEAIFKSIESNTDFTKEISTSTEIEAL